MHCVETKSPPGHRCVDVRAQCGKSPIFTLCYCKLPHSMHVSNIMTSAEWSRKLHILVTIILRFLSDHCIPKGLLKQITSTRKLYQETIKMLNRSHSRTLLSGGSRHEPTRSETVTASAQGEGLLEQSVCHVCHIVAHGIQYCEYGLCASTIFPFIDTNVDSQ
jgi:hypothetical protein